MYNKLIYKVDNDDFKSVDIDDINELNPAEYQSLVKVCNILYDKAEWKWVKAFSKFLITSGNSDVLEHLQNYVKGEFTENKIDLNKNSEITKEEMKIISETLLQDLYN